MLASEIVQVVAEANPAQRAMPGAIPPSRALVKAQEMRSALAARIEQEPAYAAIWQRFQDSPQPLIPVMEEIVKLLLAADAALARRMDALLAEYRQAKGTEAGARIDTGGGLYAAGAIRAGTVIGRDQHVGGDFVRGNKVMGDHIAGSKITVGEVSAGRGVALGHESVSSAEGLSGEDVAGLFAQIYGMIDARPDDPNVDRDELAEVVAQIEAETAKGEQANPKKVERWLRFLAGMAGDVFDVTVACLTNPVAGVAEVVRKVAQRATEG